jgi:sugar O-acyltransferase (sialic acid O-acetyltransferase NeuD family)
VKPVVLFGNGRVARLARFHLTHDAHRDVAAFTVERDHRTDATFDGLPIVAFDDVVAQYPPDAYDMFVAVGYGQVNGFREQMYNEAKALGYNLISIVHSSSIIAYGVEVGDNCFIMERNVVQPFVRIGNNVTMWGMSMIGHDSVVGDHTFLAAHVIVSGFVTIEPRCFLGVNATIRDEITVSRECVIGAGATVMKSTEPRQVLVGPTARLLPIPSDRLRRI